MEARKFRHLVLALGMLLLINISNSNAAVVVTPITNGSCLAVSPGAYTVMSNIIVTEGVASDISTGAAQTFILSAPAGFQFNPGSGTVIFTAGMDITSTSMVVTAATITVTISVGSNTKLDAFRIRNVGVRATASNVTGNILRTGGTITITGNATGGGVSHGLLSATGAGGTITSIAAGTWTTAAIWSTGTVPSCTDNVVINHAVVADISSSLNNLTINTGGNLTSTSAVTVSGAFTMNGTAIYTHDNTGVASTTIFAGSETFASTSKIVVNRWSSATVPLPTGVTGNFGAVEINTTLTWSQNGLFAPARIKNTLTINGGTFILDDGTGLTTSLTLQDVVVSGTGRIQVQTGTARNLTLVTGNFTDNSTSAGTSSIVYLAVGNLDWTVNGNLNLSHRFSIIEGASVADAGTVNVDINGDFTIGGGIFDGMKKVTGPFTMDVSGTTSITGSPTSVMFKDYYSGNLQFTSSLMTANANMSFYFLGTHTTVGAVNVNITNDLTLSGNTTRMYLAINSANTNANTLTVGNDLTITGSQLYTSLTTGDVSVIVGRNYTQTGATSEFYGQRNTSGTTTTVFDVAGSASITGGLFSQSRNLGGISSDIVEVLSIQNATFYGMNNTAVGNNGITSLNCADLNISGSTFYLHRGYTTDGRTVVVNIDNDLNIDFTASTQEVMFVSRNSDNSTKLDLNIGGNFIVAGSANGLFCSSVSAGSETIDVGGDFLINAGRVRFNAYENYTARGHDVTGNIVGSFIMSGGSVAFSGNKGVINWTITGDYDQTGGYAVYKWLSPGLMNLTVTGNYSVSNGNVNFYSKTSTATADPVTVTINGTASFDNTVVMFDSCLTSTASHKLIFKGSAVTYGDNVIFTHAAHLSNRLYFGNIYYDRVGTITLKRMSSNFDIRQTKQNITANTIVDFTTSPFDLMISSHSSSLSATHTTLTVDGTLDMGTNMIAGRSQANYYASATINNGATLKTAHTGGLYSGSAANSCIYPLIAGSYRMNYYLGVSSRVVYNGSDSQHLTGVNIGLATTDNHRYGDIEINFNGTPDVEYVYMISTDSTTIRNGLILTKGELNLDSDHITTGGGSVIHVLLGATITRTNGYIRSETNDGSAIVQWKIQSVGSFVVPFGYNSTNYIPVTFQVTSGNAGNTSFSTNRVAANNTPYPPTVTHVNNVPGVDNSANTVDRFWSFSVPGNVTTTLTFSYTASEASGITNPRGQRWEPVTKGWFAQSPTQSNPTATTTQITGVTLFNTWWALTPASTPLPIELISFEAKAEGAKVKLNWVTGSELNNDYFTIERSNDGENFSSLFTVDGAGTSSSMNSYNAYDEAPRSGINFYRLRQTDFDGQHSVSDIKVVNFKENLPVQIYPNPLTGKTLTISKGNSDENIHSISIFDLAGKLILKQENFQENNANKTTEFDLGKDLVKGTYIVEVTSATNAFRERIVVQ
jgi:hypothetical protein